MYDGRKDASNRLETIFGSVYRLIKHFRHENQDENKRKTNFIEYHQPSVYNK